MTGEFETYGVSTSEGVLLICRQRGCDERVFLPAISDTELDWLPLDTWRFQPLDPAEFGEGWFCPEHIR